MSGVRIANGSVIAATSLVHKDVYPYTIVGVIQLISLSVGFPKKLFSNL